jgi:hypothetical protein
VICTRIFTAFPHRMLVAAKQSSWQKMGALGMIPGRLWQRRAGMILREALWLLSTLCERAKYFVHYLVQILIAAAQDVDLVDGVQNCRMVLAAEPAADLWQ